ncbi:MAG: YeeE/YedE family protein [Flammeovirgaceae bacterium]|nr:YeeE/YedE family protein [Flammeovirgaceae bacterium]
MSYLKFIVTGIIFGIMFVKAEVISWYRIYEMFRFENFHMYGIIGSAVVFGIIFTQLVKKSKLRDMYGNDIIFQDKMKTWPRYILGGIIFGLGWAMTGACPGPMFTLVGAGFPIFLVVILSAIAGTWTYGAIKDKLPH